MHSIIYRKDLRLNKETTTDKEGEIHEDIRKTVYREWARTINRAIKEVIQEGGRRRNQEYTRRFHLLFCKTEIIFESKFIIKTKEFLNFIINNYERSSQEIWNTLLDLTLDVKDPNYSANTMALLNVIWVFIKYSIRIQIITLTVQFYWYKQEDLKKVKYSYTKNIVYCT